jgi:hypothetical protein
LTLAVPLFLQGVAFLSRFGHVQDGSRANARNSELLAIVIVIAIMVVIIIATIIAIMIIIVIFVILRGFSPRYLLYPAWFPRVRHHQRVFDLGKS